MGNLVIFMLFFKVADVQTNFRMPDVYSIGLGGGSIVTPGKDHEGNISVSCCVVTTCLMASIIDKLVFLINLIG